MSDDGAIVGVKDITRLMETLPNKVINILGITADVVMEEEGGLSFVKMTVHKSNTAVSLGGKFYIRSGSTSQELKGGELQALLLKANNLTWDSIGVVGASYTDIDKKTVARFVSLALEHNRLPSGIDSRNVKQLFQNLDLITQDGELTRAAVLLFGKRPTRFFPCATFKIGRFRGIDPTDLVTQDIVEENLFTMPEQIISLLRSKYLWSPISYKGMLRVEPLEIPEKAIREAVLNAIIHKDYASPSSIHLSVYDPAVKLWNAGELENLGIEDLSRDHGSYRRNPLIANIFFRAGHIEAWGRGTLMIIEEITKSGLSKPAFSIRQKGLEITFERNPMLFSENGERELSQATTEAGTINGIINGTINGTIKLTVIQQRILDNIIKNPRITSNELAVIIGIRANNVIKNIATLKTKGLIKRIGAKKDGYWSVIG